MDKVKILKVEMKWFERGVREALDKQKMRYPVVIAYVKEVSKQLYRVMKGYRLKVYFKPTNTRRL